MKKYFLTYILVIVSAFSASAQNAEIEVNIKAAADTSFIVAYHYGNKQFIYDTVYSNKKGRAVIEADTTIPGGVYLFVLPKGNYFEFLIGDDQEFSVSVDPEDPIGSLEFKGSSDNDVFLSYQRKLGDLNKSSRHSNERVQALKEGNDSIEIYKGIINKNQEELKDFKTKLLEENKGSFVADLIHGMEQPEIPEFDIPVDCSNPDSMKMALSYAFVKNHFWDDFNFSNRALIRTPVYHNKLSTYFNRILLQAPDSLILQIHKVVDMSRADDMMFQYTVVFLLNNAIESQIMGMDAVFVDIAETYYLSGEADWVDPEYMEKIKDRVLKTKPNLIGAKAQDLKMETITGEWVSLHEVEAEYIILAFWEPNCGHCKKAAPKLRELYHKYKSRGLEVFAVNTQGDKQEWQEFVVSNHLDWINVWDPNQQTYFRYYYDIVATPTVYLLDKDKKIIAKRIDAEQIGQMMEHLLD